MMMSPQKKIATIIVGKMSKKPEEESKAADFVQKIGDVEEKMVKMEAPEEDNSLAVESAAEDMIAAMEKKDAKMLVVAIKNLLEMISEDSEESEELEEEQD